MKRPPDLSTQEPRSPDYAAKLEMSQTSLHKLSSRQFERLLHGQNVVLDVAAQLALTLNLGELLENAKNGALEIFDAARATVWVYDPATNELFTQVAHGVQKQMRMPADAGFAGAAFGSRNLVNIPDAWEDPRFNRNFDLATGFRTTSVLCVPLVGFKGTVVGVMQVLNKKHGPFTADDEKLAKVLASQVAVALQRHMLLEEYKSKERMERDLNIAREIQQQFLPDQDPVLERYEIHGWNRPADETGGDTFDFTLLEDGRLGLIVCDATGHGIGPALVVAQCRAMLRAVIMPELGPSAILTRANRLLCQDMPDDKFITTFFGLLDAKQNTLTWASAGHGPMLLIDGQTGAFQEFSATGVPLGILEDGEFPDAEVIHLAPQDTFIIMTDGFLEWADPAGNQFGVERMMAVFHAHKHRPLKEILDEITKEVERFGQTVPQKDDLTAILVRRIK